MPTPPPAFFRQRCVCGVVRELFGDVHGKALSQRPSLLAAVATGTSTSAGVIAVAASVSSLDPVCCAGRATSCVGAGGTGEARNGHRRGETLAGTSLLFVSGTMWGDRVQHEK